MKQDKLADFIGDDIINSIDENNIWLKHANKVSECYETKFDASFYDDEKRVEKKYKNIDGFNSYYEMSLDQLDKMLDPPNDGSRIFILGTTEYLLPYAAYCLKFIDKYKEEQEKKPVPFIFFALLEWTEIENIEYMDCVSNYFKNKNYEIRIVIPQDRTKWRTLNRDIRITIYELIRLNKNLGNIPIEIYIDDSEVYKIVIKPKRDGGKLSKSRKRKNKNKKSKTRRKLRNRARRI
jgi:hypothetical protein